MKRMIVLMATLLSGVQPIYSQVTASLTVEFGRLTPVKNQSGFLHGAKTDDPPDSLIRRLRPALIRDGNLKNYAFAKSLGAEFQFVLSDTWGYAPTKMPYVDWTAWEAHVRKTALSVVGKEMSWDIWNEPVGGGFWPGTQEQYFETFLRSYKIIRQELGPDIQISGPCLDSFRPLVIKAFLDFCLANNVEVNILTWHELGFNVLITDISLHLKSMRELYLNNPHYAPLKIKEIHINEIVSESDQYHPGENIGWLDQLEKGGADKSARGCWGANCANNTLDGILEPFSNAPRSPWWVYRFYADGLESRVSTISSDPRVAALASRIGTDSTQAQVLVGYFSRTDLPAPVTGQVTLKLSHLNIAGNTNGSLDLKVFHLPSSDTGSLLSPRLQWEGPVTLTQGEAVTIIKDFRLHDAYLVTISANQGKLGFTPAQLAIRPKVILSTSSKYSKNPNLFDYSCLGRWLPDSKRVPTRIIP
jgi:xylan 1,4-beta-xylosidase